MNSQVLLYSCFLGRIQRNLRFRTPLPDTPSLMILAPPFKTMLWMSLFMILAVDAATISNLTTKTSLTCDSPIYCSGDLLKTVQLAEIYSDSKTFVDMVRDPHGTSLSCNMLDKDRERFK